MIPYSRIIRVPMEQGESIEEMIRRCTETNEPIDSTAPMIYTEEKNGVMPEYDIRTDRFEIALDAIEKVDKSNIATTDNKPDTESNDNTPANVVPEDNAK